MTVRFFIVSVVALPLLSCGARQEGDRADIARHSGSEITAVGCLKREADVPGRQRSFLERLGVRHDFVLTDVRMTTADMSSLSLDAMKSVPRTNGRYDVTGLGSGAMEANVNHLVAVEGRVDDRRLGVSRGPQDSAAVNAEPAWHFEASGRTWYHANPLRKATTGKPVSPNARAVELPDFDAVAIRSMAPSCG